MSATAKTVTTSCSVADGMYVRTYTNLRLDAIATAFGQCQLVVPQCTPGCVCVPSSTVYERVLYFIYSWVDITSQSQNGTYTVGRVYGKNPNGTTAYLHVLDTTQPDTTGPLSFGVGSAGEYFLHFQGSINTTICNMLPNVTPQYDIMVHARSALHRGERFNGSLVGGISLPDPGTGYYQERGTDTKNTDDWGGLEAAIRLIQTVGNQWFQNHPTPRIGILDISRPTGGAFAPHAEHQNGLDIDVRYVRNDGQDGPLDLADPNQLQNLYSRSLTIELLNLFAANGSLYRILVSPHSNITSSDVPGVNIVQASGHDNHIHVSLVDPDGADSNNCP